MEDAVTAAMPDGGEVEASMGLFETNPWLLVPIIILTFEGWTALKAFFKQSLRKRERA
jgi:hypothetical protein